jgi:hypothetical protein
VKRLKVSLNEEEVKEAIAFYVRQKFHLGAISVESVELDYCNNATVHTKEDKE